MGYKTFVINPGSTSTKLAYFDDETKLFEANVFHDAPELLKFEHVRDQFEFRLGVILDFLKEKNIDLNGVDAIVGRGGGFHTVEGGTYEINDLMYEHTRTGVTVIDHPCMLGVPLAKALQDRFGGRAFVVDSTNIDELQDLARITGVDGYYRRSADHPLNQKGTIRKHCKEHGTRYEDGNYICCHIDGGTSITAHRKGKMIDTTCPGLGSGAFSPTRIGFLEVATVFEILKDYDMKDLAKMCTRAGGFVSYFGTSDSDYVHGLKEQGDAKADLVWRAMVYQICKNIGSMATVLEGKVDAIILCGGLMRFDDILQQIKQQCEWIAPVYSYPGEVEHEAMAAGALRVLRGEETPKVYTGVPIFTGFAWETAEERGRRMDDDVI
ncbi:MAG: butyrate kinase [Mogibacterium sp.]|nr:butyrate kinase [Mogibacterium sp.]